MVKRIILPERISEKLDLLVRLDQECSGILLYRKTKEDCPIDYMFLTGISGNKKAIPERERENLIKKFYFENPDYSGIDFHTHSALNIQKYGKKLEDFSKGDLTDIESKLKRDENYLAMLVTPKRKILYGKKAPDLVTGENYPFSEMLDKTIGMHLAYIRNNIKENLEEIYYP